MSSTDVFELNITLLENRIKSLSDNILSATYIPLEYCIKVIVNTPSNADYISKLIETYLNTNVAEKDISFRCFHLPNESVIDVSYTSNIDVLLKF